MIRKCARSLQKILAVAAALILTVSSAATVLATTEMPESGQAITTGPWRGRNFLCAKLG